MATSFRGWGSSWLDSWGSIAVDPNAMMGSASFAINASLQVNSGEMQGSASFRIDAILGVGEPRFSAEVVLKRPYYVKRGKKLHIFATADDADRFLEAESAANDAIERAKDSSRQAKRRLKKRVYRAVEHETVDIDLLGQLADKYAIKADIPALIAEQDYMQLVALSLLAMQMQEDEDIELLLLA